MFRNDSSNGLLPEDNTMTRSDYQLWSPPGITDNDVDMQYFSADGSVFQNGDILEYNDAILKSIDTQCNGPFSVDDIIDRCVDPVPSHNLTNALNGFAAPVSTDDDPSPHDAGCAADDVLKIELPGDPTSMLRSLSDLLDGAGGVKGKDSAFVKIMESSVSMPVQCVLINILRCTNKNILKKLLNEGAWSILHRWLMEARTQVNKPIMMEILQLYKLMPVSTKLLKSNSCAKDIKQLIKNADERISRLAKVIVDDWVNLVTGSNSSGPKMSGQPKVFKSELSGDGASQSDKSVKVEEPPAETETKAPLTISKEDVPEVKEKPRPKTVKALPFKFRSTGLEEIDTPEPSSKSQVKPVEKNLAKKPTFNGSSVVSGLLSRPIMHNHHNEKTSKIKLIPARPLQPELSEKSAFLDALKTTSVAPIRRKRKAAQSSPVSKLPPNTTPVAMDSNANKDEIAEAIKNVALSLNPADAEQTSIETSGTVDGEQPAKRVKTKKSVTWCPDSELCDYFYFDVDPDERINVNRANHSGSDFNDHRRHEIEMERRALVGLNQSAKRGLCLLEWKCPPAIEGLEDMARPGNESKERALQAERETRVLQIIYFSQESIPDSPSEPDEEMMTARQDECKKIPLDDEEEETMETESCPEQTVDTPQPTSSLPPILTNLLGNIINQSPNPELQNPRVSPSSENTENNFQNVYSPDDRFNYNQPPIGPIPADSGNNFNQNPRDYDANFRMQHYNQRDRYSYPEEPYGNFRPRGPAPTFHQNDFRGGRNPAPRHGGHGGQVCQFFMSGNCRFGSNCRNLHPR